PVEGGDDVADLDPGLGRRTGRCQSDHDGAVVYRSAEGDGRDGLGGDAQVGHGAGGVLDGLRGHGPHGGDGDRETDALRGPAALDESPSGTVGSGSYCEIPCSRSTAMSRESSPPITVALKTLPRKAFGAVSLNRTRIWRPPSTTWKFVMRMPSCRTMKPVPT